MTRTHGKPAALSGLRRRSRALLAAVLPALVLRALIPFGFMPVAGNSGPTLELCPGAVTLAAAGHAHQHHHHAGGAGPAASAHALCLFAASATPAMASVAPTALLSDVAIAAASRMAVDSIRLPSILRAQSARAPPSVS